MELTGLFFYAVSLLILGGIYAILCLALNVQWGMGGLFNAGIARPGRDVDGFGLTDGLAAGAGAHPETEACQSDHPDCPQSDPHHRCMPRAGVLRRSTIPGRRSGDRCRRTSIVAQRAGSSMGRAKRLCIRVSR